jgi:predicted TIM-barrel fold metal-dependent hydrolase
MTVDAHQHFWKFDAVLEVWIDDSMRILQIYGIRSGSFYIT